VATDKQEDMFEGTEFDADVLIQSEVERVDRIYSTGRPRIHPRLYGTERWVKYLLEKHIDLVSQWGGWRWHGPWTKMNGITEEQVGASLRSMNCQWSRVKKQIIDLHWLELDQKYGFSDPIQPLAFDSWSGRVVNNEYTPRERERMDEQSLVQMALSFFEPSLECSWLSHRTAQTEHEVYLTYHRHRWSFLDARELLVRTRIEGELPDDSEPILIKKGQRVSAAALRKVRQTAKHPFVNKVLTKEQINDCIGVWEHLFENIGHQWSNTTAYSAVTFSCAPSTFLKLGEMGDGSCFRAGGEYEISRMVIAEAKNSIVSMVYRNDTGVTPNALPKPESLLVGRAHPVSGRAWGIGVPSLGCSLTNFYTLPRATQIPLLKAAASTAFKCTQPVTDEHSDGSPLSSLGRGDLVYHNGDSIDLVSRVNINLYTTKLIECVRDGSTISDYYENVRPDEEDEYYEPADPEDDREWI